MSIATDIVAAEIIVAPFTGEIDVVVDSHDVLVETANYEIIVETSGNPGPKGDPGAPGAPGGPGPAGPPGLNALGPWSPTVPYVPDDLVTRAGSSWLAMLPSTGIDPALDKTRNPIGGFSATSGISLGSPRSVAMSFTVDQTMNVLAINAIGSFTGPPYDGLVGIASAINVPGVGIQWLGKGDPDSSAVVTLDSPVDLFPGVTYWFVLSLSQSNVRIAYPADTTGTHCTFAGGYWYGSGGQPDNDFGGLYRQVFTLYGSTGDEPWTLFTAQGPPGAAAAPPAPPVLLTGTDGTKTVLTARAASGQVVDVLRVESPLGASLLRVDSAGFVVVEAPNAQLRLVGNAATSSPGISFLTHSLLFTVSSDGTYLAGDNWSSPVPMHVGAPIAASHAATKQYADSRWKNGASGLWKGTQAEYDAIVTKDPNVVYVVV